MYQRHPSAELYERFRRRPYQGVEPATSKFLFVGLDANYGPDLERSPSFQHVLEYHEDGPAFWRRYGVHHPFLLPSSRGDGRRYHRTFSRIGFRPEHAHLVSFVELLHVPSVGRSRLTPQNLDLSHMRWLNNAIVHGTAKFVFVSAGVAALMRASGSFPWLPAKAHGDGPLRLLHSEPARSVYLHLHFSNYGKFQRQLDDEASAIGRLLEASA